jgi:hypothetical protein
MRPSSYSRASLLLSFVAFLLLCAIAVSEVPELISLADNPSNDFAIRKWAGRESATMLDAVIHNFIPLDTQKFKCEACTHSLPCLIPAEIIPSDLLELHSVLRT